MAGRYQKVLGANRIAADWVPVSDLIATKTWPGSQGFEEWLGVSS